MAERTGYCMENHPEVSELLVETGAYRDLEVPVILASGAIGIYYVNTEKLLGDDGLWKQFGDDSKAMVEHATDMMYENQAFGSVIEILAEGVDWVFNNKGCGGFRTDKVISGGQRRDWIFSGPVARRLGLEHISLYKDDDMEILGVHGGRRDVFHSMPLEGLYAIHVADLLTEGSSAYRIEGDEEMGWIPDLRDRGGDVTNLFSIVTRLQGGEGTLERQGVTPHSFVAIDEDFVRTYSKNPERALDYMKDPEAWGKNYLRENGALAFLDTFDPEGGKADKARAFLDRYEGALVAAGRVSELSKAVEKEYGVGLRGAD